MNGPPHRPGALGGLAESEEAVFAAFAAVVDLDGADVVELGGAAPVELLREHGVRSWHSVDPRNDGAFPLAPPLRRHRARAEHVPLPDASADAVFSVNAFQFVDVRAALAEARRLLRPGGILYAHFGPIWSAVDGHQLEYVEYGGRSLVFWRDTLLPPWAHLRFTAEELRAVLTSGVEARLADALVRHVHESDTINRLFFEDYVRLAVECGLEWLSVAASSHLDYEIETPRYRHPLLVDVSREDVEEIVARRDGRRVHLGPRDVRLVLRNAAERRRPEVGRAGGPA